MISLDRISQKQKNLIVTATVFLIILIDFLFLMNSQIRILKKLSRQASLLNTDLKNAKKDIANQKEFEERLIALRAKFKEFALTVTPEEELHSVLESLSKLANETLVKITQIKPIKEEKKVFLKSESGTYYQIPITIDAQCGYHSLGKFLNALEFGSTYMKVVGLEIASNSADVSRHLVRLTVQTFVVGK